MGKKTNHRPKPSSLPPGRTTPVPGRPDRDRRVRQNQRIARVLHILNLIQSRGHWDVKKLATELECSDRTIHRDLEVLEFAGVPWYFDQREKCYRVRSDFRFPTLALTKEEILGLAITTAYSKVPGLDVSLGAASTNRKLTASLMGDVQSVFDDASRLIEVFDLKLADHSKHKEAIKAVQFALLEGKQISGVYESPYQDKSVRLKLHPYRLCLIKQAWYVVGHKQEDDQPQSFRVTRFKSLRMIDEVAEVPAEFDLKAYFGNAWGVFRGETSYLIQLRFTPDAAKLVTETVWHHTQKSTRHRDGSLTMTFIVDGIEEIIHWVLSWADRVVVESPDELRTLLISRLRKGIENNGGV